MGPAASPTASPEGVSEPTRVDVVNAQGQRLAGVLWEAPSAAGSPAAPVVILCHGFRSTRNSGTLEAVASALYAQGVTTYRFDFSGNGESEGVFRMANYGGEVEDLRSVVQFWRGQGRAVPLILGHSKGGNIVLLYGARYRDVPHVVNVCGRCNMDGGLRERYGEEGLRALEEKGFLEVDSPWDGSYRVTKEDVAERLATDMVAAASAIPSSCRVLTVHGSADETIPVEDAQTFAKLIKSHELVVVNGGDHRFSKQHRSALADAVVPFVLKAVGR